MPVPDWAMFKREIELKEGAKIEVTGFSSIFARPAPFRLSLLREIKTITVDIQYDELTKLIEFLEEVKKFVDGR